MTEFLRLKPWLESVQIDETTAIILSEESRYTLKGELLIALLPLLDGSQNEDEIAERLSGQHDLSQIYYHLFQLKEKKLIETVPKKEPSAISIFHSRMKSNSQKRDALDKIIITALDGIDPKPVAKQFSQSNLVVKIADRQTVSPDSSALWIVLTPDYLEPDLEKFNSKAQKNDIRWIPFKPDGLEPWFGPLVTPGKTACIECLLHRMRGHRIQEIQIAKEKGEPPRFSQGRTAASLQISCGLLALELEKFNTGSPHCFIDKGVVSINLKTLETRYHELIRRLHCPVCGHTGEQELQGLPEEDFKLTSRHKADYTDGGERIQTASETMARFENRISYITGEVGTLKTEKDIPVFFGSTVNSSWTTLNGHKADSCKGRCFAVGASAGKGRSEIQARTSALGEALERYCSQYFGYEPCINSICANIADDAIHPLELNQFSDSQYIHRDEWAKRAETGRVPEHFDEDMPIHWSPTWSLTQKRWKYIPSAHVYYNYPKENGGKFVYGDSNGVAAGNCIEEAIIQGFMELAERDGVAIWWYNMLQYSSLDLPSFNSAFIMEAEKGLQQHNYTLQVLNLTTDLNIPVFAAVGLHDFNQDAEPLLGFGAHFDPRIALDRAVSEMGQSWKINKYMSPNEICRKVTGRRLTDELFIRPLAEASKVPLSAFLKHESKDFLTDIEYCVSILDDLGIEMLVTDLTRPEIGLSVVRVTAPGLVHFWPRFKAQRLYDVPVKLGMLDTPKEETDFYQVPFYF